MFVSAVAVSVLVLGGCASAPTGPTMMVLPGPGKSLEQFQGDDATCRQWAAQQTRAETGDSFLIQRRYDIAYQQCMYSHGNDIPGVPRSTGPAPIPPPPPPPPPGAPPPPPPGR